MNIIYMAVSQLIDRSVLINKPEVLKAILSTIKALNEVAEKYPIDPEDSKELGGWKIKNFPQVIVTK